MFTDSHIPDALLRILILGPVSLIWIACVFRMIGLRSFSKMTAFDFIATVATGSLLANSTSAGTWTDFFISNAAVPALLGTQATIAAMRVRSVKWLGVIENEPILLMRDGKMLHGTMKKRVSRSRISAPSCASRTCWSFRRAVPWCLKPRATYRSRMATAWKRSWSIQSGKQDERRRGKIIRQLGRGKEGKGFSKQIRRRVHHSARGSMACLRSGKGAVALSLLAMVGRS